MAYFQQTIFYKLGAAILFYDLGGGRLTPFEVVAFTPLGQILLMRLVYKDFCFQSQSRSSYVLLTFLVSYERVTSFGLKTLFRIKILKVICDKIRSNTSSWSKIFVLIICFENLNINIAQNGSNCQIFLT